jgi:cytochrome b6-f complex iron-sulfur subunit
VLIGIAIAAVVLLALVFVFTTAARRDRRSAIGVLSRETRSRDRSLEALKPLAEEEPAVTSGREVERAAVLERRGGTGTAVAVPARTAPPSVPAPVDPETYGVTRRQFLNRGIVGIFGVSLAGFGATCLAFLWPSLKGGFGSKIKAGELNDIMSQINDTKTPVYVPEGRFYLNPYPKDALDKAKKVYSGGVLDGMNNGLVALYQKCVHLGCRVPWCKSSQWFECPCHGSKYNRVGEKKGGPAPRGLDRFAVTVDGGVVSVDTKVIVQGPVIGTNTTGQEQEGPHCA